MTFQNVLCGAGSAAAATCWAELFIVYITRGQKRTRKSAERKRVEVKATERDG
jgi:hypothetical protein